MPLPRVLFLSDDRLSRDRAGMLARTLTQLSKILAPSVQIETLPEGTDEELLMARLETGPCELLLLPWHAALKWKKADAFFGANRLGGPTCAGYFAEPVKPEELGSTPEFGRFILLNLSTASPSETARWIRALSKDSLRTGLQPLFSPGTKIYRDYWAIAGESGARADALCSTLGEPWIRRDFAIRSSFQALWSLAFASRGMPHPQGRADFRWASDGDILAMRACFAVPKTSAKQTFETFWPNANPSEFAQALQRSADGLRVHFMPENQEWELTAFFMASSPSTSAGGAAQALWIEPISSRKVTEIPFAPAPSLVEARAIPTVPPATAASELERSLQLKEKFVAQALDKIRELKNLLTNREAVISELRAGGVGTAPPLPPPDTDALLEAFQSRYFESRFQIHRIELRIAECEAKNASAGEIEALRARIQEMTEQEALWIKKLAATIEAFRRARKKA